MRRLCGNVNAGKIAYAAMAALWLLPSLCAGADELLERWRAWPRQGDYTLVTAWVERPGADSVFGFRAQRIGGDAEDIYLAAGGSRLTEAERRLLGIFPKRWDDVKASASAPPHYAAGSTRPKRAPRIFSPDWSVDSLTLPPLDLGLLLYEDAEAALAAGKGAMRTGAFQDIEPPVTVAEDAASDGAWRTLPNGTAVWSLRIDAPGAYGLRPHLSSIYLSEGVTLSVYPEGDASAALGPYTQSDFPDGAGWLGTLFADSVVIECVVPYYVNAVGLYVEIDRVVHHYVDLENAVAKQVAGNCNLGVACYPDYGLAASAVAGLSTIGTNGSLWCTGALIADLDPETEIPYFLTAYHCVSGQNGTSHSASNVELFWFYQQASCGGSVPRLSSVPRTSGGLDFLAGNSVSTGTDFSLLRLRTAPPAGAAYLGWSAAPQDLGTEVVGVHHPSGSHKRISFGGITNVGRSWDNVRIRPIARYHEVHWNNGTTEPGSSGSPVLSADGAQILGQLWGGYASCLEIDEPDYYGRFDGTYPIIQRYLDPNAVLPAEDIDKSGRIDASDVQLVINAALGVIANEDADVDGSGAVDSVDIQRVINAVLVGV